MLRLMWVSLLIVGLCSGCQGENGKPPAAAGAGGKKKLRIAVIPKGTTHEFWKSVHAGAQQAATELGDVEIFWKSQQLEKDREGQISVLQDFITKKVDGIVLAPLDSQALVPYVQEAKQAGIPVVIFDSGLNDQETPVSYVATDNTNGGALAARHLAELLGKKGNVILARYNQGSESTALREDGFLATLAKEFPDIKVLSSNIYIGTTPEESLDQSQQLLIKFGKEVNGVFTVCEPNTTGMLRALEQENLVGKVKFIGFDPAPPLLDAMRAKKLHGIVVQDPVKMGYEGLKSLVNHIRGKEVPKRIVTGEYLATPENMDTPEMQKLLSPVQHE
ncbi:MAG: substrate-binding domain-containing protein [Planctomycetota bacterium]